MDTGSDTGDDTGGDVEIPEPAAEGYNVESDFPLLMERKGMDLQGLKDAVNKSNVNIDKINTEVDTLLKD